MSEQGKFSGQRSTSNPRHQMKFVLCYIVECQTGACWTTHQRDAVRVRRHCAARVTWAGCTWSVGAPVCAARWVGAPVGGAVRWNLRSTARAQLAPATGRHRRTRREPSPVEWRPPAAVARTDDRHERARSVHVRPTRPWRLSHHLHR